MYLDRKHTKSKHLSSLHETNVREREKAKKQRKKRKRNKERERERERKKERKKTQEQKSVKNKPIRTINTIEKKNTNTN